jgi:tetratricopeptide (TPR) repeat protein
MERKKFCITAISGNEEKWAKQWAESIMKTNPDYVVFNLTQYDDNTEKIIREVVPKEKLNLVKFPWQKSFSEARNHCLTYIPDDADYCMYLDMDEVITKDSYVFLESFLNSDLEPTMILCNIYNNVNQKGMVASLFYPRIWPHKDKKGNLLGEYFDGEVHNQLIIDKKYKIEAIRGKFSIMHYGYALNSEDMKKKHERSEELLRKQIEKDNDNFFAHLNLAQLLRAKGDYEGTEKHSREVLRIVEPRIEHGEDKLYHAWIMAGEQLTTALMAKRQPLEALKYSKKILERKPDHLDSIMNTASCYLDSNNLEEARFWLKRYLFVKTQYDENRDNTNLILNHLNSSFIAHYHLGLIAAKEQKFEEALDHFKKSFNEQPEFRDVFIKYIHTLRVLKREKDFMDAVNNFMLQHASKSYIVYSYFTDISLEELKIENAKFNAYQAYHLTNKDAPEYTPLKERYESLIDIFGEISPVYFDTTKRSNQLTQKIGQD